MANRRLTSNLRNRILVDMTRALQQPKIDAFNAEWIKDSETLLGILLPKKDAEAARKLDKKYGLKATIVSKTLLFGPYTAEPYQFISYVHPSIPVKYENEWSWWLLRDQSSLEFAQPRIVPNTRLGTNTSSRPNIQDALSFQAIMQKKRRALIKDTVDLVADLVGILWGCNTVDQLLKILPKAEHYLPAENSVAALPIPLSTANRINDLLPV